MFRSKLIMGIAVACVSSMAFAASSGFYVGGAIGRNTGEASLHDLDQNNSVHAPRTGVNYEVVTGYNFKLDDSFGLGLEAGYDFGKTKANPHQGDDAMGYIQSKNTTMLSLKPSFTVSKGTDLFARVGAVQSSFSLNDLPAAAADLSLNKKNRLGAVYGVGFETALGDNFALTGEYNHVVYQNAMLLNGEQTEMVKLKNNSDKFKLGVAYYFG